MLYKNLYLEFQKKNEKRKGKRIFCGDIKL